MWWRWVGRFSAPATCLANWRRRPLCAWCGGRNILFTSSALSLALSIPSLLYRHTAAHLLFLLLLPLTLLLLRLRPLVQQVRLPAEAVDFARRDLKAAVEDVLVLAALPSADTSPGAEPSPRAETAAVPPVQQRLVSPGAEGVGAENVGAEDVGVEGGRCGGTAPWAEASAAAR